MAIRQILITASSMVEKHKTTTSYDMIIVVVGT
jgi:hypothetical protein